ncbi:hypothetical protein [Paenibacillus borealis]|uniref:Ricin B lectin domain-containing protein n=1 Tax=Paenibacillus borealis TaxID=160799 RepID=A0A089MN28_PAEBO|nr:hypothetical protein [Paenibacillus borealis]AIQ57889.1 hypothetical protein PBOR_13830 [Paenibacillus borealis]
MFFEAGLLIAQSPEADGTSSVEVITLAYDNHRQLWTVEYGSSAAVRLRNQEMSLCVGQASSLTLEPIHNDAAHFHWLLAEEEENRLVITYKDGRVLTAEGEKREGAGRVFLEQQSPYNPGSGPSRQYFQLLPVREYAGGPGPY